MVDLQSRVPGGSAANVVKGIAGLAALRSGSTASAAAEGAPPCAFVGKVGEDAAGHEYAKRLAAAGVQVSVEYTPYDTSNRARKKGSGIHAGRKSLNVKIGPDKVVLAWCSRCW
jgi:sugar/nucleoside kinase (ribokinase family)